MAGSKVMDPVTALLLGLAAGFGLGAVVMSARAKAQAGDAQAELAAERARAAEREASMGREQEWLERQTKEMKAEFQALAAKTLEASNKSFLDRASERMKPLKDELVKLSEQTQKMETARARAYGSLEKELESLRDSTATLHEQSSRLATALRGSSQARGRYGEMLLRNVIELAGMTEHCDFIEQKATADGKRPDVVVLMPGKGRIPIDAKCPMAAFQKALDADDPKERAAHFAQHAKDLGDRIRELKQADYASRLDGDVDFTVMFLPGDNLLAAAFQNAPDLQEKALKDKILIATPVTLIALLRTVGLYWRQHDLAEGAREIQGWAEELHKRVTVFAEHLAAVGKHLGQAQGAYNKAVGSYESRVLPAGRRLEELNATKADLPAIPPVEQPVREISSSG